MTQKRSFFEKLLGTSVPLEEHDERPAKNARSEKQSQLAEEPEEGELAVDVFQTPVEIVIQAMISGVKPENLEIALGREMVTIKGRREPAHDVPDEDYFQHELYWGSFSRTILLPAEVEVEEAEALEKHGLLTIRLPKVDKDKTQNLKVKSL